jgi:hypothetical protein
MGETGSNHSLRPAASLAAWKRPPGGAAEQAAGGAARAGVPADAA